MLGRDFFSWFLVCLVGDCGAFSMKRREPQGVCLFA
jgi:hypothetical protein